MWNRHYLQALASYLLIPAVTLLGGGLIGTIDPEWATRTSDYEGNFRLLLLAKNLLVLVAVLVNVALWLLTCFFLLKAKKRSYQWLLLAAFGPFGFIVLAMLGDKAPAPGDLYQKFVRGLKRHLRTAYELGLFLAVWGGAHQAMAMKRDLVIQYQSAATGVPAAEIIRQRNASSGMWAFGEGLEILYFVVLIYFLWPILFNAVGRLPGLWAFVRRSL